MYRILMLSAALLAAACFSLHAQESATQTDEMQTLRATVEAQGRQIAALTNEVARLAARLDKMGDSPAEPIAAGTPAPAQPLTPESAQPPTGLQPPPPGTSHIVKKGENLINIAKQYGVTVAALAAANHIADARKLQIGQSLRIPQQAAPIPVESAPTATPNANP